MSTQVPTNSQDGLGGHPPESNPNTTITEHWHELVRQCTIESFVRLLSWFTPDVSSYRLDPCAGRGRHLDQNDGCIFLLHAHYVVLKEESLPLH